MAPQVLIPMADYGNDPTEVAVPFQVFTQANFVVRIATERGAVPECDRRMLGGVTGTVLGATRDAKAQHEIMLKSPAYAEPLSWTAEDFHILDFDLILLPGGHDKGMRQYIESQSLHHHLEQYVAAMREPRSTKCLAAICHGVQVLAAARQSSSTQSILHDFETTALPAFMEQGIFWGTRLFLGDYYKTFGAGTPSVEEVVKQQLDEPAKQWKTSHSGKPFTHRDPHLRYISARFPPDAQQLAEQAVAMVTEALGTEETSQ